MKWVYLRTCENEFLFSHGVFHFTAIFPNVAPVNTHYVYFSRRDFYFVIIEFFFDFLRYDARGKPSNELVRNGNFGQVIFLFRYIVRTREGG